MTSHKEEPNPSILFGDSAGDDPFSQILQQNSFSEVPSKEVIEEKKTPTANDKKAVGDASSLFGGGANTSNTDGNDDLFFSSAQPQVVQQPLTSNASAAGFFEQPVQSTSESFFDGLGQPVASSTTDNAQPPTSTASLTQAFDPNTYSTYEYSQQTQQPTTATTNESYDQQQQEQQQQQVEYDSNQWIQFDPNVHYYYDDQNQVHYYDPNTNQEYDMSQSYDEQGQNYDYQYDPQYAEYYAQQGYDPATYAATTADPATYAASTDPAVYASTGETATVPEQAYTQDNYDPNAYAPVSEEANGQDYFNPQTYAPVNNAIAEVPAQIQSEQTIGTQHYPSQQDEYGLQHNYAPTDASTEVTQVQQQDYDYGYETTDLQYAPVVDHSFAPVTQDYSQTDFFAEDLQQQAPSQIASIPPPPKAKSVLSPPQQTTLPPQQTTLPPPKNTAVLPTKEPDSTTSSHQAVVHTSVPSSHRGSYDEGVPLEEVQNNQPEEEVDLNDLDHLVLGNISKDNNQQEAADELDRLVSGSDFDIHSKDNTSSKKEPVFNNPNEYEEEKTAVLSATTAVTFSQTEQQVPDQPVHNFNTTEKEPVKSLEAFSAYEPQQGQDQAESHGAYDSQQYGNSNETYSYEPQQDEQAVNFSSYEPQQENNYSYEQEKQPEQSEKTDDYLQQAEQTFDYSSYAPQQSQETNAYSSYTPQQTDPTVDYSSYEPKQTDQTIDYSSYAPQQTEQTVDYSSYVPQQTASEKAQPVERSVNHSSYAPQQDFSSSQPLQQQQSHYNNYEAQTPLTEATPMTNYEQPKKQVTSLPPRKHVISPPPPANNAMHAFTQQRSNSITEPDRKQNGSPFTGYYNQYHIERSATVPPPMTERIASPRPILTACPDPQCEGENKAKAKFCCECGRPLAGISRSTTPSASLSPGAFSMNETINPIVSSYAGVVEPVRTALDDKKDVMMESLSNFNKYSILVHPDSEDKQKLALDYIESRTGEFQDSKALLWNIVKLMIQHQDHVLGGGGKLDESIADLLVSQPNESPSSSALDKLEHLLAQGDREGACQFATENDMWAHALIISQSHNPEHFKRVISQFIDRELFSSSTELIPQIPGDKKALRMLYSVFSGAGADAVVQLTRDSAEDHPTTYTKESLDDWKKALSLILVNRSSKDVETITELGDQLKRVGSFNDAFICYMLLPDTFAGLESQIIGAEGTDIYTDLDALYLTELYEYALSTSSKANLQQYKLIHAWWLSEFGFTNEAQIYCDSIVDNASSDSLQRLKSIGEISNTVTDSEYVTSLLKKATFDALIGTIEEKISSGHQDPPYLGTSSFGYNMQDDSNGPAHDYSGQEAADTLQQADNFNYGYSYGGGNTETADNSGYQTTAPFTQGIKSQAKGIQSPFQNSTSIPQNSPFQSTVRPVSSPFAAAGVHSPFQHAGGYTQPSNENVSAWGVNSQADAESTNPEQQTVGYQPYQPETPAATSYQPDSYAPTSNNSAATASWNDDDDLGFGNSKKATAEETKDKITEGSATREEKPNEVSAEDKKEEKSGGWGIFSLFGRKEKEQNSDEKKAVKANLGEQSSFYYDEKEKRWVNKLNDSKPETTSTPPPPKSSTPQPISTGMSLPPMGSSSSMAPPAGLKPVSMPPVRINSTPNVPSTGGPPSAAPPAFSTPPASRRGAGPGSRKPMRSRYVDVLNTN